MHVLIVNTSDSTGGAAIAANRLCQALHKQGVEVRMLVRDRRSTYPEVIQAPCPRRHFLWERLRIFLANRLSKKNLWRVDIANTGTDITLLPEFAWADVIHLHWINQGFLSLHTVEKILRSGKKIVWTLHDLWPVTGICHHCDDCTRYQSHCAHCPLLVYPSAHDLSYSVFRRKEQAYAQGHITFVGCSQWIADMARKSALVKGHRMTSIPNAIDSGIFFPQDQAEARRHLGLPPDVPIVLFCSRRVDDYYKGMHLLKTAMEEVEGARMVCVGKGGDYEFHDQRAMARLYAAADVFVSPSLQENLPNTIAEAMSCGTPCVGFRTGGVPEMIDHQTNGYVADYADAADLARGIRYVLAHPELREAAHRHAAERYSEARVAREHIRIYEA